MPTMSEYLVKLGFQVSDTEMQKMHDSFNKSAQEITKFTEGITKSFTAASVTITGIVGTLTTATIGLVDSVAQADLGYKEFAMRMHMTDAAAKTMKITLDAMHESIQNVWWMPEVGERFKELQQQAAQLEAGLGPDADISFKKMRDLRQEWTRMQIEATYGLQYIAVALIEKLGGPLDQAHNSFKDLNDYISTHMKEIADKIADGIAKVVNVFKMLFGHVEHTVETLETLWESLTKGEKEFAALGGIIAAFFLSGPIGQVDMVIAGLIYALGDFYDYVGGKKSNPELAPVWDALISVMNSIKEFINNNMPLWNELWNDTVTIGKDIWNVFKKVFDLWLDLANSLVTSGTLKKVGELLYAAWQTLVHMFDAFSNIFSLITESKAFKIFWEWFKTILDSTVQMTLLLAKAVVGLIDATMLALAGRTSEAGDRIKQVIDDVKKDFEDMGKIKVSGQPETTIFGRGAPTLSGAGIGGTGASGYDAAIRQASQMYNVPEDLIRKVIQAESSGNPNALSSAGAIGLMQLMPGTAAGLGVNPYDPVQNIMGGTKYLSQMLQGEGGNVYNALRAYNAGPGWRQTASASQENINYPGRVLGGGGMNTISAAAQNYTDMTNSIGRSLGGGNYSIPLSVGDVNIHINQPGATKDDIYSAVMGGIQTSFQRQTARQMNSFSPVIGQS